MRTDLGRPRASVHVDQHAPTVTLQGRWLLAARAGWGAVAALTLVLVAVGFAEGLDRPDLIPQASARAVLAKGGLPDLVTNLGLLILTAAFVATGLLIFSRRSDDWAAMLFALTLMTSSIVTVRSEWALERALPSLELPIRFVWWLSMFLYLIIPFVFPDGRFVPRWTWLLGAAAIPAAVMLVDIPSLLVEHVDVSRGAAPASLGRVVLVWSGFWGAGIYAQIHRYRHVSGPVQRQQTKWVALSLGLLYFVILAGVFIPTLFFSSINTWLFWALLVELLVASLFPTSVAVAILRHRLYDIDRLVSRTLTFGLLTVVLGVVYTGAVVVLGQALDPRDGDSTFAVAASTLLVAALFRPARRRIQSGVDRRFNRRKYDALKTVDGFTIRLRDQLDVDALTHELLNVVQSTMEPARVSLWLPPSVSAHDPRISPAAR